MPINSERRCTLERPFITSKIDIPLCRFSTVREIECSRVLSLETRSYHKYVCHEIGRIPVKERREVPKPHEQRKIRLEMLVPLLTSWALKARNILGALGTEGSWEGSLRIVEELPRTFQDVVDRAKVHHSPRKNGKGGNDGARTSRGSGSR